MNIASLSDLHLKFDSPRSPAFDNDADLCVLAGGIHVGTRASTGQSGPFNRSPDAASASRPRHDVCIHIEVVFDPNDLGHALALAMVTADRQHMLYLERSDIPTERCSAYARNVLLPAFTLDPRDRCTCGDMAERVRQWLSAQAKGPRLILSEFAFDLRILWKLVGPDWLDAHQYQSCIVCLFELSTDDRGVVVSCDVPPHRTFNALRDVLAQRDYFSA